VHCNKGYGFANRPHLIYHCNAEGKWLNMMVPKKPAFPDCSKKHKPKGLGIYGQYFYLTDECGGEDMNEEIAGNFIDLLNSTSLGQAGACSGNRYCKIENVRVECGETTRHRRDVPDTKQSTIPLTVSFTIKIPLPKYSNSSLDLNQTSLKISNDILGALDKADLSLNISGVVIIRNPSRPPEIRRIRVLCDEGQVQSGTMCVNCPVGYFFNGANCQACAVDQYQEQEAQTSCVSCPSGTSTSGQQASKRKQDCQDLHKTDNKTPGISKQVLISAAVGGTVFVILLVISFFCVRKYCLSKARKAGPESSPVGFTNQAYDDIDWRELRLQDL